MRVRLRCLIGAILLFAGTPCAWGQDARLSLADLIEQAEPSCVRLDTVLRDGKGIGSGFVVERSDWIVTNYHVVAGATKATATFADGTKAEVEGFLAYGVARDVAILKIKPGAPERKPLPLCLPVPRKGEEVVAMGAPQGLSFTAAQGIISAIRDGAELMQFGAEARGTWLQTTTPISPGSSGGPLLNARGEVVGATSASLASAQNLNFAISAKDIADIVKVAARSSLRDLSQIPPLDEPERQAGRPAPQLPSGETVVCYLPAERRFSHRYRIAEEEDEFDKIRWLRTEWIPLVHNDRRLAQCGLRVGIPYREDAPPRGVVWEISTTSRTFAFLAPGARRFQILLDGESVALGEPEHKGDVGRGGVAERLTTLFTIQGFSKVIMAKEVKARVGSLEYQLAPGQLECLRDLASRLPTGDVEVDGGAVRVVRYELAEDPTVPPSIAKKVSKRREAADPAKPKPAEFRTWRSADGKFTVEAKLIDVESDAVVLERKDNGRTIRVPLAALSEPDRRHVRDR